jgi:hypothetical protein
MFFTTELNSCCIQLYRKCVKGVKHSHNVTGVIRLSHINALSRLVLMMQNVEDAQRLEIVRLSIVEPAASHKITN